MRCEDTLITPPTICDAAEIELAHRQMRRHRRCGIERCAWKWVAYYTLVHHGRIAPQRLSPRERAHRRGVYFPTDSAHSRAACGSELRTFQQVLDGLAQLAQSPIYPGEGIGR
ncbi:hypothetical protein [Nocardia australiensis]|uniref:hypothetical protein n=1 Tax=Nocardia australiensis TaxID=2887191 RepID=UPI001D14028A|nr:hypothetical protein [Nocardia australiensis]